MENWSKKLAKSIMERTPRLYEEKWYKGKWSYDYGVVLKGFQLLWERTQEKIYFDFIKDNIDYFVQEDGTIRGYSVEEYNIDHVNTGKLFFLLYKETGEEKYKKAAELLSQQLANHPRTSEGAFWHKEIYPYQIWLDGLYMGSPFYAEFIQKSTHNRRERPVHGHRGGSRGRFYYRITTFEGRPWDARDPYKTTFMALKHEIRLSIWRKQKETPGVEKAPGVSSPQRKESGRSGRDDGELRFWVRPGHPYKAVTSISQAEALAHGLTHLHHLVFAAVLARELDWCAALQDAREDARPWGVVGIGLRSDVWVEVRRDDHRPAVLVT